MIIPCIAPDVPWSWQYLFIDVYFSSTKLAAADVDHVHVYGVPHFV